MFDCLKVSGAEQDEGAKLEKTDGGSEVGDVAGDIGEAGGTAVKRAAVDENKNHTGAAWNISFEQFLASILTESVLVDHFSQGVDVQVFLF